MGKRVRRHDDAQMTPEDQPSPKRAKVPTLPSSSLFHKTYPAAAAVDTTASHPTTGAIPSGQPVQPKPRGPPSQKITAFGLGDSMPWGIHVPKGKRSLRARRTTFIPNLEVPSEAGESHEAALTPVHLLPGPIRTSAVPPRPTSIQSTALPATPGSETSVVGGANLTDLIGSNSGQGAPKGLPPPQPATVPITMGTYACCETISTCTLLPCTSCAIHISTCIPQSKSS